MKAFLFKLWHFVKNPYVAVTIVFVLLLFFLSENNIRVTHKLKREVAALTKEADILERDIHQDSIDVLTLFDNPDALETYAREHYYMKRDNEDIFIVRKED